jgi:hypothetical protein
MFWLLLHALNATLQFAIVLGAAEAGVPFPFGNALLGAVSISGFLYHARAWRDRPRPPRPPTAGAV